MWIPSLAVVSQRTRLRCLAALVATLTTLACARPDNTPPVGSVTVEASTRRVPIGSPLELSYRFVPTEPIEGDYTVFVHLVNEDGQILWADDHLPPAATSTWVPGTPVEYSRTVFLPAVQLRPGNVTVEAGLYRDEQRLPLEAARPPRAAGSRAYPVVDLQLAPESENVFLLFQDGWYPDEFASDLQGRSWKWTEQSATIGFRHPRADGELWIEYAGTPGAFPSTPQVLRIAGAGDEAIASFVVDHDDVVQRRIPVRSEQMGGGELGQLRVEVDRTFVPADIDGGGDDTRVLGVRVYNVFLDVR